MNTAPRKRDDYDDRQVEAARRVLVDLGQVLASYVDSIVVVGGWAPDLLLPEAEEKHVGSIDVDLALDIGKLTEGRYAKLLKLLLDTKRYRQGENDFQLVVDVDLKDGQKPVLVDVDFLAPKEGKLQKNKPKLLENFRILRADGCGAAFHAPVEFQLPGRNVRGARNTVRLMVASLADFLIMKAHAIAGREKPKDTYDLCYCLEHHPGGIAPLSADWKRRAKEKDIKRAIAILTEKFADVDSFGPQQLVDFHAAPDPDTQAMQARQAYELVRKFLEGIEG